MARVPPASVPVMVSISALPLMVRPPPSPSEKLLLLLFEKIIEDDVLYLSHIDMSMDEMEERLLSGDDEGFLHELTKFRRKLSELNAFYVQTEEIMGALLSEICSGLIAERASWQELSSRLGRL